MQAKRFIISGGGSGGHVFPAIAIADAIKQERPDAALLFVGAKGRLEMEKVPQAGYSIKGLWISGLKRSLTWRNLLFPIKLFDSLIRSRGIIRSFKPDAVIGVGGYASGPVVAVAALAGIPTVIQEQNSYAGLTNKWLARRVDRICVAYENMESFFPADKITVTGNPVRLDLLEAENVSQEQARHHFGLDPHKRTVLVVGGSLGARTLNRVLGGSEKQIELAENIQFIWQIGKLYESDFGHSQTAKLPNVQAMTFIDRMDMAYRAADLVICRAGALTISELCLLRKASILVPSPNVAEDHQTMNAKALVNQGAALYIPDVEAENELMTQTMMLVHDTPQLSAIESKIGALGKPGATRNIVNEIFRIADKP